MLLSEPAGAFGRTVVTFGHVLLAGAVALLGAVLLAWRRGARQRAEAAAREAYEEAGVTIPDRLK